MSETTALQRTDMFPVHSLDAYIARANQIPMLTEEEEHSLAVRFAEEQDLKAARQLVLSHLRFVVKVARGYDGYGLAQADLIQEGNIGLMKAVKRFDPHRGVRLVTFAVHWIKAEIHEFIIRNWRIVKVATTKAQRKLFFNLRRMKSRLGWFKEEEVNFVASELGVKPDTVRQMEARMAMDDTSFHAPSTEAGDEAVYAPENYLEDHSMNPERLLIQGNWEQDVRERLYEALENLDERSRDILQQRWLNEAKTTLHDLAKKYDVSAERVRQLEASAMKKVRSALTVPAEIA